MKRILFLLLIPVALAGCVGPLGFMTRQPVDVDGALGRCERRPPDLDGVVGPSGTPATWEDVPSEDRPDP